MPNRCDACDKIAYSTQNDALDAITTIHGYTHPNNARTYPCPFNTHWWHITTTHPHR